METISTCCRCGSARVVGPFARVEFTWLHQTYRRLRDVPLVGRWRLWRAMLRAPFSLEVFGGNTYVADRVPQAPFEIGQVYSTPCRRGEAIYTPLADADRPWLVTFRGIPRHPRHADLASARRHLLALGARVSF